MRSVQGQESVRLLFRLRTGIAGLLKDKKCDKRCVMCDSGAEEDIAHFLVGCGEYQSFRLLLLGDVRRIAGSRE